MDRINYLKIDPTALLGTVGDKTQFIALSQIFLAQAPTMLDSLQRSLECRNFHAIAIQSHALKGMTVLVGASEITMLLQRVESAAGKQEIIPEAYCALQANLADVTHEVERSIIEALADL